MSAQETRYIVWEDYTDKLGIVKIDGIRYPKVVKVKRSGAVGHRAQLSIDEWDKLPRAPEFAVSEYVNKCQRMIDFQSRQLERAVQAHAKAELFKQQWAEQAQNNPK